MKKICFITTVPITIKSFVLETAKYLKEKCGYDVTLICSDIEKIKDVIPSDIKTISVKMERGVKLGGLKVIKQLKAIFKNEKFDLIQYATPNASFYASIASKKAKIKTRVYNQCGLRYVSFTGLKRKIFKFVEKITCKYSTHIRAQSPMNMDFAVNEGLCKKEKISVVGIGGTIGVDLKECDAFNKEKVRETLREKYEIPTDAFVYGFVGRLNKDKGINELIEAFSQVEEKVGRTYLVLVGMNDTSNPITPENLRKAEMDKRIILTGNIPQHEVYRYMAMFDVMVHPTYREGFGKVLQEAMGMSLPIITTNVPGPSEVIAQGEYGLLVEVQNVGDLVEKMLLIEQDDNLRKRFACLGRKRAEEYFDRPIMLNNILVDMNNIMGE